jgi:hypothetical protein
MTAIHTRLLSATGALWLALAFGAATPAAAQQAARTDAVEQRPVQAGTGYSLQSTVLGDRREINVWVPADYATSKQSYTTLYLLDGALDQDFGHVAGLAQLASLSWTFGPFIVVGIQTKVRMTELTSPPADARYRAAFPQSGGAARFRRFLEQEVIPFVGQRYRTGSRRALMGESLAGLFVVDTLLNRPDLFNDYVAISPSLWWDDRRPMRSAADTVARHDLSGRHLYLALADEGGTMQNGVDMLRAALARHAPPDFRIRYSDRSAAATHATVYHGAAEEALRWLYPAPPYNAGPTPWYMIEGASPPAAQPPAR